ncbi:MAG TPA: hypothetical protein VLS89_02510 [Candidatus Nanopelagicales bacterium]|nr:hypothetical protein [Candidatus Nanopelagicales bacterium]
MAAIQNVTLIINKLDERRSEVVVEYDMSFSPAEIQAGSIFVERIGLRGNDPLFDDDIAPGLVSQLVQAQPNVPRRAVRRIIPTRLLDEDRDRSLLGLLLAREDELIAQVSLMPFMPRGATASSQPVEANFGPSPALP